MLNELANFLIIAMAPEVLKLVGEWCVSLLTWLCSGLCQWCGEQGEPSTHMLLATQSHRRAGAGPLLRSRMAGKKNIRGAQRAWKEDGAKWTPGPNSVLRDLCRTHLHYVRCKFAGVPVLELCFDGSQVSIRNHDIFAAYSPCISSSPTGSGGGATYLPPVRVPELGWRT